MGEIMEKTYVIPVIPLPVTISLVIIVTLELIGYGVLNAIAAVSTVTILWPFLAGCVFYLTYMAILRRDALPLIFTLLFLTAYHSLLFNYRKELPIALLFVIIFLVNSAIMWLLLRYATRINADHHIAYSVISGFMIAQIITVYASMAHDWPIRFELASYVTTVFSYICWRFTCFSTEANLGWYQIARTLVYIVVLVAIILISSIKLSV
jgi:hypothetical protein